MSDTEIIDLTDDIGVTDEAPQRPSTLESALAHLTIEQHSRAISPHPRHYPATKSAQFIEIDDEDSTIDLCMEDEEIGSNEDGCIKNQTTSLDNTAITIIDSDDDDEGDNDAEHETSPFEGLKESMVIIDLLDVDETPDERGVGNKNLIAETIRYSNNGVPITCGAGKTVEFTNGSFMRIERVVRDAQMQVFLIGKLLVRQNSFTARAPKRRNEVVWTIDSIDMQNHGLCRRLIKHGDVVRNRKLIMTNRAYPRSVEDVNHPRNHPDSYSDPTQDVEYGPLFCRIKRCCHFFDGMRVSEERWEFLTEGEADGDATIARIENQMAWRGPTVAGGAFAAIQPVYNLETGQDSEEVMQSYTFGDSFCGAGGTSCGAREAGLHVLWSFDFDERALLTYQINFPDTVAYHLPVHEFIGYAMNNDVRVDVLHLSPPCQPFSPAHTVPNARRDEPNEAALLSVGTLLEVVKPRIVTLEQTLGLQNRHVPWFCALLHDFLRAGYSFHWRVVNCADYGVPQTRRRLIFIGAGPGEQLPEFPEPTHGPGPGLQPVDTVRKVLGQVDFDAPNHDTTRVFRDPKPPYDPDVMARTVTCNGGVGNYHPAGLRKFTVREFASFQTFPPGFKLANVGITNQRRQVGNAVPPRMAEVFYKAIIKSLKESDGVA